MYKRYTCIIRFNCLSIHFNQRNSLIFYRLYASKPKLYSTPYQLVSQLLPQAHFRDNNANNILYYVGVDNEYSSDFST